MSRLAAEQARVLRVGGEVLGWGGDFARVGGGRKWEIDGGRRWEIDGGVGGSRK
jgi:hypothetical protein